MIVGATGIEAFKRLVAAWAPSWKYCLTRFLAIKHDGVWNLVLARRLFLPEWLNPTEIAGTNQGFVQTDSIWIGQYAEQYSDDITSSQVAQFSSGDVGISIGDNTLRLIGQGENWKSTCVFNPTTHRHFPGRSRWAHLDISVNSALNRIPNIYLPALNLELAAHERPFRDIDDVFIEFGIPPDVLNANFVPRIELIAIPPIRIADGATLVDGNLRAIVQCGSSIEKSDIRLTCRIFTREAGRTDVFRKAIPTEDVAWYQKNEFIEAEIQDRCENATFGEIYLNYKGEHVEKYFVQDPSRMINQPLALSRLYDTKNVIGENFLNQHPNQFEDLVCLLWSMLGYTTLHLGRIKNLQEAPDILVLAPLGLLYVVECTTGDPARSGKLLKLKQRVDQVRVQNQLQGLGLTNIQAVVVTSVKRADTAPAWQEASLFQIAIIAKEEIEQFLSVAHLTRTVPSVFEFIKSLIPVATQPPDRLN